MNEIKFSVLIPVYNVERYLVECLESVLHQTYENFEVILVDDGSTDGSGVICDEYEKKDNRIKVYHKPNGGLFHTRRFSEQFATGDYVVFLDSDDYWREDTLEVLARYISEYGSDCIVYGYSRVTNDRIVTETVSDKLLVNVTDKRWLYLNVFCNGVYNSICRKAVKRECVGKEDLSRYYSFTMGEDTIQTVEILVNAKSFTFVPDVLYYYRYNPKSVSFTHLPYEDKIDFVYYEIIYDFLKSSKLFSLEELLSYKVRAACGQIVTIMTSPLSFIKIRQFIRDIYHHPFVAERTEGIFSAQYFALSDRKNVYIYHLFEHSCFSLLASLAVAWRCWRKIKRH